MPRSSQGKVHLCAELLLRTTPVFKEQLHAVMVLLAIRALGKSKAIVNQLPKSQRQCSWRRDFEIRVSSGFLFVEGLLAQELLHS